MAGAFKTVIRQYSFSSELKIVPWNPTSTAAGLKLRRASESPAEGMTPMEGPTRRVSDVGAWGRAFLSFQGPGRPHLAGSGLRHQPGLGFLLLGSALGITSVQAQRLPWPLSCPARPRHLAQPSGQLLTHLIARDADGWSQPQYEAGVFWGSGAEHVCVCAISFPEFLFREWLDTVKPASGFLRTTFPPSALPWMGRHWSLTVGLGQRNDILGVSVELPRILKDACQPPLPFGERTRDC